MLCKLLNFTPLTLASNAIRQSHDNQNLSDSIGDLLGEKDKSLIDSILLLFLSKVFYIFVYLKKLNL